MSGGGGAARIEMQLREVRTRVWIRIWVKVSLGFKVVIFNPI